MLNSILIWLAKYTLLVGAKARAFIPINTVATTVDLLEG